MEKQDNHLGDILAIHFFPEKDISSREHAAQPGGYRLRLSNDAADGGESISLRWLDDIAYAARDLGRSLRRRTPASTPWARPSSGGR